MVGRQLGLARELGIDTTGVATGKAVDSRHGATTSIQYPGARFHVINRGNLQHDVFATDGVSEPVGHTLTSRQDGELT